MNRKREKINKKYIPQRLSSDETRPDKSGSSPYQKIHNSLAAVNDNGGGAGDGAISENPPAPIRLDDGIDATRRHTQSISPAKQREKLDNIGSSRGVLPRPPVTSPHTIFRHFIPQRSV